MEKLKSFTIQLSVCQNEGGQVKILQTINKMLLTDYMLEINNNLRIYPIEVESYYYNKNNFPDDCVHQNDLQRNRFGKLYFHRKGNSANNTILYKRSGIDVCLSDSDNCYFGVLIRSAQINNEQTFVGGPALLTRRVIKFLCQDELLEKITDRDIKKLRDFENNTSVLTVSIDDKRKKDPPIFNSTRIGLNTKTKIFADFKLRSLTDLSVSMQKETTVLHYMEENGLEPTTENVKQLLGYVSKAIIEKLRK